MEANHIERVMGERRSKRPGHKEDGSIQGSRYTEHSRVHVDCG